jgi:hypothetical protein
MKIVQEWVIFCHRRQGKRYGRGKTTITKNLAKNQPIRLPGLEPGVCSGLILSGAFNPGLKIGVWRRRTYQREVVRQGLLFEETILSPRDVIEGEKFAVGVE